MKLIKLLRQLFGITHVRELSLPLTPLWEYKQPFKHRASLVIVGMEKILNESQEITITQYVSLVNPMFVGQTSVNDNGTYWVVFKENDVLYKVNLFL